MRSSTELSSPPPHRHRQICVLTTTAATAATPPAWRAARWDRGKVPTWPAPREYATMTKQVGFQRLGPRPAQSRSSTWPCLLCAGDDSHAPHCAADQEEDGTDSCVDCWPRSEGKVQCKSKKKKRKGYNVYGSQVSERTERPAVCAQRSERFDRLAAFSTGNQRQRLRARGEGVGPPLAITAHLPKQSLVLFSVRRHACQQCTPAAVDG